MRYFLALFLALAALAQPRIHSARVDAIVQPALAGAPFPGVAVAIVTKDGVFAKGYGVRSLDTRQPVTAKTIFALGSVTKSFTALGAALLVDEGKLEWDRPVREYLPWFRMYDSAASELMTIRDMLTHRSGLPRYDFIRMAVPLSREELVRRLRYLPPTASFRERYQYQNLMYTAAGYLTGVQNGTSWEELIERRILAPLGMNGTTVRVTDTRQRDDYASPHERVDGTLKAVQFYDYQKFGVGPNGAVNSSAEDMVKYLKFHLSDGTFDGKRILSQKQMSELHRPHMVVDETDSYGLGWLVRWTPGFKMVSHGGSITGFNAFVAFAPSRGEGVAVLVNSYTGSGRVSAAIIKDILNWNVPPPVQQAAPAKPKPQVVAGPMSHPLSAYAGRYTHPAFGPLEVTESQGKLVLKFPALTATLEHVRFDVFTAGNTGVQFVMNHRGEIDGVRVQVDPQAPPVTFARE